MRPRILFAALFHETHSFLSETTTWAGFEVTRAAEILAKEGDGSPTDGFLTAARRFGWEVIPTISVMGLAGGPVEDAIFEAFWREFVDRAGAELGAGVDAIFLVLHGAMSTQSVSDVEGEFLARLRALPGAEQIPIFGTLDLHANVSERLCGLANGLLTYRKNPHTDAKITAARAAELLQRCLVEARTPRMCWCRVPIVLTPPATGTQSDPMLSLTQLAQRLEADDRSVWAYNVAAGFSFGDRRESGLTLGIVTDASLARVREHLRSGAELAWQLRSRGGVTYPSPDAVLSSVPADAGGPILLIEPADNIGGGAPGDGTGVLRALIAHDAKNALVALNDPQSVARLEHVPLGGLARLALGGRGWSADLGPLEVEATLLSRGSGAFRFEDPNNHLASATGSGFDMGPCAVVRAADTTVLLTSHKTPPFDLGQFRSQGIQPEHFKWIGIKAAVGHRQAYDPIAAASYYVDTPGPCSNNLALLPYRHLQRPVYPLDTVEVPTFVYR